MPRPKRIVKLNCGGCGVFINRPAHRVNPAKKLGRKMVCSQSCRNKITAKVNSTRNKQPQEGFQKEHKIQQGSKHWNWKGGVKLNYERVRKGRRWKDWRIKVFQRDKYSCKKCKQVGNTLHPHHIQNYSEHPKIRFSVDNGITLCRNCHKKFHDTYGRRSNTKGQLESFLLQVGS